MKLDAAFFEGLTELPKVGHEPMTTDDLADGIDSLLSGAVRCKSTRIALTAQLFGLFAEFVKRTELIGPLSAVEAREEAGR